MSGKDIFPGRDSQFDTLQDVIIRAVTEKAAEWNIPGSEISALLPFQSEWTAAWNIAKNKNTSSKADRVRRNDARKAYKKMLRPFIQRWIFRNALMESDDIMYCGLRPRHKRGEAGHDPLKPTDVKVTRQEGGIMLAQCKKMPGTEDYGCVVVQGRPLPSTMKLNAQGQWLITHDAEPIPPGQLLYLIDENKSRKKKFTGLRSGQQYYFYFYTINFRGVSPLSDVVSLKCW